jgi:hypothetical protein
VPDPLKNGGLGPFRKPKASMGWVDTGVLLQYQLWLPGFEGDLRTSDTRAGCISNQNGPTQSTRLEPSLVQLGDVPGADKDITHVKILTRSGLHDVVKRRGICTEMFGKDSINELKAVAPLSSTSSLRPLVDHRPVGIGQAKLAGTIDSRNLSAKATRKLFTSRYGVVGCPREEGSIFVGRRCTDDFEDSGSNAFSAMVAAHSNIALHEPLITSRVRPAKPHANGSPSPVSANHA